MSKTFINHSPWHLFIFIYNVIITLTWQGNIFSWYTVLKETGVREVVGFQRTRLLSPGSRPLLLFHSDWPELSSRADQSGTTKCDILTNYLFRFISSEWTDIPPRLLEVE